MRRRHAAVIFLFLGLLRSPNFVEAKGYVGCLFSKSLCRPEIEWCFDDYAFGRCLGVEEEEGEGGGDLYRYDLGRENLGLLQREMERLIDSGYRWSHLYTQCVLRTLLESFRYRIEYDEDKCSRLSDEDLMAALTALEGDFELYPQRLAHVKFTPSIANPHAEYADEYYAPFSEKEDVLQNSVFPSDVMKARDEGVGVYPEVSRSTLLEQLAKPKRGPEAARKNFSPSFVEFVKALSDEYPYDSSSGDPSSIKIHFTERYNTPDRFRMGFESKDYLEEEEIPRERTFARDYNTPDNFRNGIETKDLDRPGLFSSPEEREFVYENYRSDERPKNSEVEGHYTEGGMVYLKDEEPNDPDPEDSSESRGQSGGGFKRPERLDVKKPGPAFSTNNYAFGKNEEDSGKTTAEAGKEKAENKTSSNSRPKENNSVLRQVQISKPETKKSSSKSVEGIDRVTGPKSPAATDRDYAYFKITEQIPVYTGLEKVIEELPILLNLSPNTFTGAKIESNEVTFRVEPNKAGLNSSEVAHLIYNKRAMIEEKMGIKVIETGIGKREKKQLHLSGEEPASLRLTSSDERQMWILSFLLCGAIAAVAIAGAALFVVKRHSRTRDKLQNLTRPDSEASKDYQDLCRARMATKTAQEKPEGGVVGHRVTNLTRESEGSNHSPSSRSSTSSWSEEPALTNMDISTGHMVLSYMEDHLKNKDRLEQEWVALCAYEAEPCATTIALKGENGKKNRYNDVLPYDHARVVLNELSNISGSDYINASTITDHDPRNPAYIATQGPLPHTAADFWQMVWEQGSVVMVMLTRLTENGTAMCHRYWPEEGSELYHIYEVHLVSEHIWCDDYLVRSFYLKNLKTGETRTVTQFHFLSWPENGVPLSTKALLEFRRKVNKSYRGRSCPIVVHCSDGVGRTGTYCLIDMVLNRMAKGAKEIDIAATLEHIRDQRPLMVRTKQQFEFVLMAVAEEVHAILKALPANHSPPPVLKEKE